MSMFKIVAAIFSVIIFFSSFFIFIFHPKANASHEISFISPLPTNNDFISTQTRQIKLEPVFKNKINILLLGLDGRIGDKNPRCDAIHVVSFGPNDNTIVITSVPRGTEIEVSKNEINYISNYCHYFGIEATKKQIEKIIQLPIDYTVKLGFSQTLGILRTLNIPTTDTLQFLRNRSITYGDYQRSHNQAQFIKDMILNNIDKITNIPGPIKYLLFKMIDTDLPYDLAVALLKHLNNNQINKNPENIKLVTKPVNYLPLAQSHFTVKGSTSLTDKEFVDYQNFLKNYLNNLVYRIDKLIKDGRNESAFSLLKTPFSQQIWLQLEDEKLRNEYHFALLKEYVQTTSANEQISSYISDFIEEMALNGQNELKKKAQNLLKGVI